MSGEQVDPASVAALLRRSAAEGRTLRAQGPSMAPRVPDGATLSLVVEERAPKIGEVWVFVTASNDVTAHRFLRRTRLGRFVFFGDTTDQADMPVRREWLVGRVDEVTFDGRPRRPRRTDAIIPTLRFSARTVARRVGLRSGRC